MRICSSWPKAVAKIIDDADVLLEFGESRWRTVG
jgi:hypothetical protein